MKKLITVLILIPIVVSCKKSESENNTCFTNTATTRIIVNKPASIFLANNKYYLIEQNTIDTKLLPCNLAPEFAVNGLQVVISGEVKNTVLDGSPCCRDNFFITKISR